MTCDVPLMDDDGTGSRRKAGMSIEQTATSIVVRAVLPAEPDEVFALLADPVQHSRLDGSGNIRGVASAAPLTAIGQTFTMDMSRPELGCYKTENTVIEFVPGRTIAWTTTRPGNPVSGFWWRWDVEPAGGGAAVTHTHDWSAVTDPAVLARVSFPQITAEELLQTVDRLAAAVQSSRRCH
jgi:uncharacterized protein YndB with AHSA1/START domain